MSMPHADRIPFNGNGTLVHTLVKCYTFVQVNKAFTLGQPIHL